MTVQADAPTPINTVGQIIQYTYFIKNIGTEPLPGVVSISGATVLCPPVNTIGNQDDFLDPGVDETLTCASSYTIIQEDLDRGSVTSVTTADVNGTLSNAVTTTVATTPNRVLTLTKTVAPLAYEEVGDSIVYTYVITNSGTLDIGPAQFTVTDTGISTPINCGNADTTLAPNATVTCSATYIITQADMAVDVESVSSSATASGGGVGPSEPVSAAVTKSSLVENPANLPAGSNHQHKVVKGEWLWQIARCYGSDPVKTVQANPQLPNPAMITPNIFVTVPNIGSVGKIYGPDCVLLYTVQAGDTWNSIALKYNADPLVLQIANSYSMPVGTEIKIPLNSAGGTIPVSKGLTLTTAANPSTYNQAGQVITYTYVLKNSGTSALGPAQFTISDSLISAAPFNCGAAGTTLAPAATVTCTATYTITADDMTAVSVTNIATASGGGAGPSKSASVTVNKSISALTLTTAANPISYNQAGQVITYTYVIKNSGSSALGPAQFTISDSLISAAPFNCGAADTTLAPEATVTCTATYTITANDMNASSVTNIATASGGGAGPSQSSSTIISKGSASTLTLVTAASPLAYNQAGQVITYTYVIRNSGSSTLGPAQFTISDSLIGAAPFNCGAADTTLAPNALATCTATYTITAADMNANSVTNLATASGGGAGPSQSASIIINKE
jgi:LysM repeat protein